MAIASSAEAFANLLLLYVKYEVSHWTCLSFSGTMCMGILCHSSLLPQYYDLAADVLAENGHLTYKCLSPYLFAFINAKILGQTSPEEVNAQLYML